MKTKTIKAVLRKKFDQLTESIKDESVRNLVEKNTIITGGAIASMLLREPVNDFDLYFRDRATAEAVANYYVTEFKTNPPTAFANRSGEVKIWIEATDERVKIVIKSAGIASEDGGDKYKYFEGSPDEQGENYVEEVTSAVTKADEHSSDAIDKEKPDYRPVFMSANAISLSGKVQIIVRFFGEPAVIHANYDFLHCTCHWTSWDSEIVLPGPALECLLSKELRYIGSKYPLSSIIRTRKFIKRDFTINAGQYLKMCFQLSQLDLTNLDVLEDQLIGVDSAYFLQLISRLKEKDPAKVDAAYLMTIIDRIF